MIEKKVNKNKKQGLYLIGKLCLVSGHRIYAGVQQ